MACACIQTPNNNGISCTIVYMQGLTIKMLSVTAIATYTLYYAPCYTTEACLTFKNYIVAMRFLSVIYNLVHHSTSI